jgi:hypothetical protein
MEQNPSLEPISCSASQKVSLLLRRPIVYCHFIFSSAQIRIDEDIKSRLNSGNAWYYSVKIFSWRLLSKSIKIK